MTPAERRRAAFVRRTLDASPFSKPAAWRSVVVVCDESGRRVVLRADFAAQLASHDLDALAHECVRRTVPRGSVLVFLNVESDAANGCGFIALPITN